MSRSPQVPGVETRGEWREGHDAEGGHDEARRLLDELALADDVAELLTLPAHERIAQR